MKKPLSLLGALSLALALGAGPAQAARGDVFVYTGSSPVNEGYTNFAAAADTGLEVGAALPVPLDDYPCVVLPANSSAFDPDVQSSLIAYVYNGGTLFALGEHSFFASSNAQMNAFASAVGSSMSISPGLFDNGFTVTTSIEPSAFTVDVDEIIVAGASAVSVGSGTTLVRESSGEVALIAAEQLGQGLFVLSGDTNAFSDNSSDGYTSYDNGQLVANLCVGLPTTVVANPAIATVDVTPSVYFPNFSARLTATNSGSPLEGQTLDFIVDSAVVCSGVTDANGVAACGGVVEEVGAVLAGGYTASFAGALALAASSDDGPLLNVLGEEI